jgi:colicin import membrane protein
MAETHVRTAPRRPRVGHRTAPSFMLALLMHGLLFGGMTIAVRWKTEAEAPAVAEVWGALPPVMEVAPAPPPPPPPPPEVKREPEPPPAKEPEIVEKQEKKAPPKKEEKKVEEKKPEPDRKKLEEERQRKQLEAQREAIRKEEAARLEKQLAGTPGAAPSQAQGRGTDSGWEAQVKSCVRPHVAYNVPEGTTFEVRAEFAVEVLPTGEQVAVRLTRPSNLPGFDAAAERAIRRCDPIPRQKDGTVPRSFTLILRPVEMR